MLRVKTTVLHIYTIKGRRQCVLHLLKSKAFFECPIEFFEKIFSDSAQAPTEQRFKESEKIQKKPMDMVQCVLFYCYSLQNSFQILHVKLPFPLKSFCN